MSKLIQTLSTFEPRVRATICLVYTLAVDQLGYCLVLYGRAWIHSSCMTRVFWHVTLNNDQGNFLQWNHAFVMAVVGVTSKAFSEKDVQIMSYFAPKTGIICAT